MNTEDTAGTEPTAAEPAAAALTEAEPAAEAAQVLQMARGYMVSQVVYVTAKLGLADLIASGVNDLPRLAAATGTDPEMLRRLLRVARDTGLVSPAGVSSADDGSRGDGSRGDDRYRLTPTGDCLREDHPHSVRHMSILLGEEHYRAWSELLHSVRSGEPAMPLVLGEPVFTYLAQRPDAAATFNRGMAELVQHLHLPAIAGCDFDKSTTVVDIGGGTGGVLRHLLQAHSHLRGVLFDRPDVVADAVPELRTGALAGRCQLVGGDFFTQVPEGADTYLLCRVLHDFDDDRAGRLLRGVRSAIAPGGRLLVLERVLPDDGTPHLGHLHDLNMLVVNGGRERARTEFADLLTGAGFRLDQLRPAPESLDVIVAVPA